MKKIILTLSLALASTAAAVDITKFVTEQTSIIYDATGADLVRVVVSVRKPDSSIVRVHDAAIDPPQANYSNNHSFLSDQIGEHIVVVYVEDSSGKNTTTDAKLLIENRPPEKPSITTSGSPVMGKPITLELSGSDPDSNLTALRVEWRSPLDPTTWQSTVLSEPTPAEKIEKNHAHTFDYVSAQSFGDWPFRVVAIDAEGLEATSDELTLSPANPSEQVTVKAQLRANPDMSIWFNNSPVTEETFEIKKYEDE